MRPTMIGEQLTKRRFETTMNMPRFTAEASLDATHKLYRQNAALAQPSFDGVQPASSCYIGVAATTLVSQAIQPAACDSSACRRHCLEKVCDPDWGGVARCFRGKCQCF